MLLPKLVLIIMEFLKLAKKLIYESKKAGADAVKFQKGMQMS